MKALSWIERKHLDVVNIPEPEIREDEVLLSVRATGICGSDLHAYLGHHRFRVPPACLGMNGRPGLANWDSSNRPGSRRYGYGDARARLRAMSAMQDGE